MSTGLNYVLRRKGGRRLLYWKGARRGSQPFAEIVDGEPTYWHFRLNMTAANRLQFPCDPVDLLFDKTSSKYWKSLNAAGRAAAWARWRMDNTVHASNRADGWKPMREAPKDGTRILLWDPGDDGAWWRDIEPGRWGEPGWHIKEKGRQWVTDRGQIRHPLGWRPLEPPAINPYKGVLPNPHDLSRSSP